MPPASAGGSHLGSPRLILQACEKSRDGASGETDSARTSGRRWIRGLRLLLPGRCPDFCFDAHPELHPRRLGRGLGSRLGNLALRLRCRLRCRLSFRHGNEQPVPAGVAKSWSTSEQLTTMILVCMHVMYSMQTQPCSAARWNSRHTSPLLPRRCSTIYSYRNNLAAADCLDWATDQPCRS